MADLIADLIHVCPAADWAGAEDRYLPDSFARDGFLHLCTPAQLSFVLARHFEGRTGLVALHLDPARLDAEIRWVRSEPGMDPFPHLYGGIPFGAVTQIEELGSEGLG